MYQSQRYAIMAALMAIAFAITTQVATAQSPPEVTIQREIIIPTIQNGHTIPPSWISACYAFTMSYGSTSQTLFRFTECKRNGELIYLMTWNDGRSVHMPADIISYNSRTENFRVETGDTLSFYRDMEWVCPATNHQDTNNYYALDTLEMITYLVSADDGRPLAQLDSIGVMPRTTPGMPRIYGNRPVMAMVSYIVPPELDGDSVLIGITMKAHGSGPYHYVRYDCITVGLSQRLHDPSYQQYLTAVGPAYARRSVDELMAERGNAGTILNVTSPTGSRELSIKFSGPQGGGMTAITIYDATGSPVFYPYSSRTNEQVSEATYQAPATGIYFIGLEHNGQTVATRKITITK